MQTAPRGLTKSGLPASQSSRMAEITTLRSMFAKSPTLIIPAPSLSMLAEAAATIHFRASGAVHPRNNESSIAATRLSPHPTGFTTRSCSGSSTTVPCHACPSPPTKMAPFGPSETTTHVIPYFSRSSRAATNCSARVATGLPTKASNSALFGFHAKGWAASACPIRARHAHHKYDFISIQ